MHSDRWLRRSVGDRKMWLHGRQHLVQPMSLRRGSDREVRSGGGHGFVHLINLRECCGKCSCHHCRMGMF